MSVWRPNKGTLEHLFILRMSKSFDFPLNQLVLPFHPFLSTNSWASRWDGLWVQAAPPGLQNALCGQSVALPLPSGECGLPTQGQEPRDSWSQDVRANLQPDSAQCPDPVLPDSPWVPFLDLAAQKTAILFEDPEDPGSHPAWPRGPGTQHPVDSSAHWALSCIPLPTPLAGNPVVLLTSPWEETWAASEAGKPSGEIAETSTGGHHKAFICSWQVPDC